MLRPVAAGAGRAARGTGGKRWRCACAAGDCKHGLTKWKLSRIYNWTWGASLQGGGELSRTYKLDMRRCCAEYRVYGGPVRLRASLAALRLRGRGLGGPYFSGRGETLADLQSEHGEHVPQQGV